MGLIGISVLVGLVLLAVVVRLRRSKYPLPPGPRPWPVIGNVLDMPTVRPWEKYREWNTTYNSDLIHLHLPRDPAVIVGTVDAAMELFEKRSQIYSNRIRYVVANMMGWDYNTVIMPYTAKWRDHRKMFHAHLQQSVVGKYTPVQLREARAFLARVLESPKDTREHVRLMITSIIVSVTYGRHIDGMEDDYVQMVQHGVEGFSKSMMPGKYWVEFMPFLRHVPSWVPFTDAKRLAEKYRPYTIDTRDKPYAEIKALVDSANPRPSLASSLCEEVSARYGGTSEEPYYHEVARNVAALTYSAASDTTGGTAEAFLLAMALYPGVQRKAQDELDRVVGPGRLPLYEDMENLPYCRAVVMETTRWLPVVPFGVPHAATSDDTYKGYHIAKGTVMIPNTWAMLQNPEDYPEPDTFLPERFLDKDGNIDPNVRDPTTMAFGFGRRICPGKTFAINAISLFAISTLHAFDITPGVDAFGKEIGMNAEIVGSLLAGPKEIPTGFKPRSEATAQLIREAAAELDTVV